MSHLKPTLGIAATAAMLALSAAAPTTAAYAKGDKLVPCYGVNDCKGHSDCKTARNDCKGQNDCKGHGFKDLTKAECAKAGGSLKQTSNITDVSVRFASDIRDVSVKPHN